MTHSRRKGATYEREVGKHLTKALEHRYEALNRSGFDGADGKIDNDISVEMKNQKTMNLAGWLDQAWEQSEGKLPVVIHKRRGKSDIGQHYVTMDVATFLELVKHRAPF